MIWKTRINQMTKTKYPLIMGAFAGLGIAKFAAAFSNSGGFGIITALNYKLKAFKNILQRMQSMTDKPFGINISVRPPGIKTSQGILTEDDYLKYVEIGLDEGINIFTTSAYQATFIGKRVHEAGCYWFHKCALPKHALSAEKAGADAITLVGLEGAGAKHPLQNTTLVNITSAKKMLKVPLIAAGGIGDAYGLIGALAMGAEAVCLGTALLLTKECPASEELKKRWIKTNIFEETYHKKIYDFNSRDIKTPSPAIVNIKKIIPMKTFIEGIMENAERIVKSWGFTSEEFNTIPY
ncbi:MAG: nitronate monooxygenase [Promethearchaeota archaeon]|nr:MAG: nitronate monooxygenase [Candidatus Lokiarchaeota archaeon]